MKNYIFLAVCLINTFSNVFGYSTLFLNTNYTMEDVKNSEIIKCKGNSLCPHYSGGCNVMNVNMQSNDYGTGYCNLSFICRKDRNCVVELKDSLSTETGSYLNTQTYEVKENFSEIKEDFFVSSCNVDDINKYTVVTETNNCKNDANCYSGSCQNGICVSDPDNPTYHCFLDYPDTEKAPILKCEIIDQVKCDNDKCYSNKCNYFKKNEIITSSEIDKEYKNSWFNVYLYASIFVLSLISLLI